MKFQNKYGYFTDDGREYVITDPHTPRPWSNIISNGDYSMMVSQTGGGYSWRGNAGQNRITRSFQDLIKDDWGKYVYIRDTESGKFWSAAWMPVQAEYESYKVRHGIGYTVFEHSVDNIFSSTKVFVDAKKPVEYIEITLKNNSSSTRKLDLTTFFELALGNSPDEHREFHRLFIDTTVDEEMNALLANKLTWFSSEEEWKYTMFHGASEKLSSYDTDKETIIGQYRNEKDPIAMHKEKLAGRLGRFTDASASLRVNVEIPADGEKVVVFTIGAVEKEKECYKELVKNQTTVEAAKKAFEGVHALWNSILEPEQVQTPDDALNFMTNTWLKYQAISCRIWGKSAYYQVSAGYGYRDQLQDSQIFLVNDTSLARKQILMHAGQQFKAGDVYHWWFTIGGGGPRTNCSDDLLWLPFILDAYLKETKDFDILNEVTPFVDGGETDVYTHCRLAIERCFHRFSPRGVPLMGDHDWNDGLSAVGPDMKGESFWVAEFLYMVLENFIPLAESRNDTVFISKCKDVMINLKEATNRFGWDGEWYLQATTDEWVKVGSKENDEGQIFLNPNIWAVMSGIADEEKAKVCMDSVTKYLLKDYGALLLYPAYTKPREDIGYISRYAPGLRENGGVYTHAATWAVWAYAMMGDAKNAYEAYKRICPPNRSDDPDAYWSEPYVTPGNSDGPISPYFGRGSWTWYTGSAQWLHRVATQWILGVRPSLEGLEISPCIPSEWKEYTVKRTFRGTVYNISVKNPNGKSTGVARITVDGKEVAGNVVPDMADGKTHMVEVIM